MKKSLLLIIALVGFSLTGCVSENALQKLAEYEKLGITKATVTGKFSSTDYTVTKENGTRKAVIDHTDAWFPKIHIERETPITPAPESK